MKSSYEIQKAQNADWLELLEKFGIEYIQNTDHAKILCVFHEENSPSLAIYFGGNYYCYGCNETGNIINFVMKILSISFPDAIDILNNLNKIKKDENM